MFGDLRTDSGNLPLTATWACALVTALACAAMTETARAQTHGNIQADQSQMLRERVFGRGLAPTGRYTTEDGRTFVLDHSGGRPLLRFADSNEVWVLRATPAPRGDILYRNDNGEVVLRSTPSGGVTVYSPSTPSGEPASPIGPASGLERPQLSAMQLVQYLIHQSSQASRAVGHLVVFNAEEISPGSETLVAEAAAAAVEALTRMSRASNMRDQAQRVRRIVIVEDAETPVRLSGGALFISVYPDQGPSGRPSSARVVRALAE